MWKEGVVGGREAVGGRWNNLFDGGVEISYDLLRGKDTLKGKSRLVEKVRVHKSRSNKCISGLSL